MVGIIITQYYYNIVNSLRVIGPEKMRYFANYE